MFSKLSVSAGVSVTKMRRGKDFVDIRQTTPKDTIVANLVSTCTFGSHKSKWKYRKWEDEKKNQNNKFYTKKTASAGHMKKYDQTIY